MVVDVCVGNSCSLSGCGEKKIKNVDSTVSVEQETVVENEILYKVEGTTLTIYGTGCIEGEQNAYPWTSKKDVVEHIIIEDGITSIGEFAFYEFAQLKSFTLLESVTEIQWGAFNCCNSLDSITIPEGTISIEESVFQYSGLKSVTLPASVTDIGENAFGGCENLESITIPDTVTSVPKRRLGKIRLSVV